MADTQRACQTRRCANGLFRDGRDRARSNSAIFNASERPTQPESAPPTFVRFLPCRAPSTRPTRRTFHISATSSNVIGPVEGNVIDFCQLQSIRPGHWRRGGAGELGLDGSDATARQLSWTGEAPPKVGTFGTEPCRWHLIKHVHRARTRTGPGWYQTHRLRAAAPRRSRESARAAEPSRTPSTPRTPPIST